MDSRNISAPADTTGGIANSQNILHAVMDATPDAIFVKDLTGRYVLVNAAAARFIGLSAGDIIGKHDLDIYPEETAREFIDADCKVLNSGEAQTFEGETTVDGVTTYYLVTKGVYRDKDGKIQGLFGISHDITSRKQAEEAQRKAEREQQRRQGHKMEAVGRLAGGVAHDFNNLLTAMLGQCELLLEDLPEQDPRHDLIEEIQKGASSAAALTRQLLAFSRQQVIEPAVLDINAVIGNVGRMLSRVIGEDVQLDLVLNPTLDRVKADPGQLEQILMNLVVNARDAMPFGGHLTIETANVYLDGQFTKTHLGARPGPHVMIAVSDTGSGMTADVQTKLFEPFFTTKPLGQGTGLGLASVYGIVKQNNGSIWVYSEVGRGTTFKIFWPTTTDVMRAPEAATDMPTTGSETILVVEDNEGVQWLVREVLTARGYNVCSASDAIEAAKLCEETPHIDLLLTDIVMPGKSGPALAAELTAKRPELAVLFMSGYTDDTIVRHGVVEAGTAFLQKPFTASGLALKVRQVLDTTKVASGIEELTD